MYPQGTSFVHSNLTARSPRHSIIPEEIHQNKVVFFGGRYLVERYIIQHWNENFFSKDIDEVCDEYVDEMNSYLGPNTIGSDHIRKLHAYGRMPIVIKSLDEGTRAPIGVPLMVIESIGDDFFWVTNYLETIWSTTIWLPITSATTAHAYRTVIEKYAEITGGNKEFVMFQGHDFSFRGMAGLEAALMSGAGHLTSFYGSDTVPAIGFLNKYYDGAQSEIVGVSVPATEHAVSSSNICDIEEQLRETGFWNGWSLESLTPSGEDGNYKIAAETAMVKYFITELFPTGIVSLVSDTYDYWSVLTKILPHLKDEIMARDGKLVIRPDSGDPIKIVCGYSWDGMKYSTEEDAINAAKPKHPENSIDTLFDVVCFGGKFYKFSLYYDECNNILHEIGDELERYEVDGSIKTMSKKFGTIKNDMGYDTLDSHIGLIYGDSINFNNCEAILSGLEGKGFASDNLVFGFGSFGYQMVTRDTYGMAVKATFCTVNGKHREIYKDPKTGSGKKSAKGLVSVLKDENGELYLRDMVPYDEYINGVEGDQLKVIFKDGEHLIKPTLEEIRSRLWS